MSTYSVKNLKSPFNYLREEAGREENCEELVKTVCKDTLKLQTADQMLFDRAHRVGARPGPKPRPIVVKFHYYHERERASSKKVF